MAPISTKQSLKRKQLIGFVKAVLQALTHTFLKSQPYNVKLVSTIWKHVKRFFKNHSWATVRYTEKGQQAALDYWANKEPWRRPAWIKAGTVNALPKLSKVADDININA